MNAELENFARWRLLFRCLFDSSPANCVLLDLDGVILETNSAWRQFARENGMPASYDFLGKNYMDSINSASLQADSNSQRAFVGLQEVLRMQRPKFTMVYPCHSPQQKRWFQIWAQPQLPTVPAIVVAHYLTDAPGLEDPQNFPTNRPTHSASPKTMH